MAVTWLRRLAARAPVPVYPAIGAHAAAQVQDLALDPRLQLVNSPRHARVILVAGPISPAFTGALRQILGQVPRPMATVWWRSVPPRDLAKQAILVDEHRQLATVVSDAYQALLHSEPAGERDFCPQEPAPPWEGLGDSDPGLEGILAGQPYGRAMSASTDAQRDGLKLDPLSFTVGPFWLGLPPGLRAGVTLHGDVVDQFEISHSAYPIGLPAIFFHALQQTVPIAELELARARYHLRQLSRALWLNGLESQSLAVLQRLHTLKPGQSLAGLRNRLRRTGFFASAGAYRGILSPAQARRLGGATARASGISDDVRRQDRNYQRLGFKLICNQGGNCHARWHQWFDEIEQSLELAARAQERRLLTANTSVVETPRGAMQRSSSPDDSGPVLEELLPGLEWSEAMATIASLDLAAVSDYGEDDS